MRGIPSRPATSLDEDVNMKTSCPRCNCADAWRLGDGRYKCRSCNRRYSWRSVWDAIRLPEATKQTLAEAFAGDAAAAVNAISPTQRQRFYRLVRACCALHSPVHVEAMYIQECNPQPTARLAMRGWASTRQVVILSIAEHAGIVRISLPPASPVHIVGLLRARSALGGVLRVCDDLAYASLPILNGYVSKPHVTRGALGMHVVEDFWHQARKRLQEYRRIPLRQLPFHLSEFCFRFNRRGEYLPALLQDLLQSTAMSDVRPLLDARHERAPMQVARLGWREQDAMAVSWSGRVGSAAKGAVTAGTDIYE